MRTGPRVLPRQIYTQQHNLTLLCLLSLDLQTVVSLLLMFGSLLTTAFVLSLGYLPVYFGRIVFTPSEMLWMGLLAGTVALLIGRIFLGRINHFRRILRFAVLAPGQISHISTTPFEFRIDYVFWFQHCSYTSRNAIRRDHQREQRTNLRPGQPIITLVNRFQPDASVVLELYTDKIHSN